VLIRLWWLKRKLGRDGQSGIITAEYTIVRRERQPGRTLTGEIVEPPAGGDAGKHEERPR